MTEHDAETKSDQAAGQGSRRALLSKGAVAAAVGAAAGIALSDRASAADGGTLFIGVTNTGASTTLLNGGSTLRVSNGGSVGEASIYGTSDDTGPAYGVHGRNTGTTASGAVAGVYGSAITADVAGVYGLHEGADTNPGPGVRGSSENGPGVYGTNTNSLGGGIGVRGVAEGTTGGNGVRGEALGTKAAGVFGFAAGTESTGVEGQTTALGASAVKGEHMSAAGSEVGVGVRGTSDNGSGVVGAGSTADLVAAGAGIIRISATVATDVTPTSSGQPGSLARNSDGSLWYYFATNSWQKLAGTGTAGSFHPVTPFRVYDSRRIPGGLLSTASFDETISVKDARDPETYAITAADATPAGATAVSANVAVINTSGNGFLSVNPGGDSNIGASAVNWFAGARLGNAGIFRLDTDRQLQVIAGGNSNFELLIDITGYWL